METRKLPQFNGTRFITDGGLETTAIFKDGLDLPGFSSIHLVRDEKGRKYLKDYYESYIPIAKRAGVGFILESPTWRSSSGWASEIRLSPDELTRLNKEAILFLNSIKAEHESEQCPLLVAGCIGPRGDGYVVSKKMTASEAMTYHLPQVKAMAEGKADYISALTLNYEEEAIGIALAAREANVPVSLSFTVETDGHLPNSHKLDEAIAMVDEATNNYVSYYMVNCAHPTHFQNELQKIGEAIHRICGVRANASKKSHKELDNSTTLDEGNPEELGRQLADLERAFPHMTVLGGCCGTDLRHIEQICKHRGH